VNVNVSVEELQSDLSGRKRRRRRQRGMVDASAAALVSRAGLPAVEVVNQPPPVEVDPEGMGVSPYVTMSDLAGRKSRRRRRRGVVQNGGQAAAEQPGDESMGMSPYVTMHDLALADNKIAVSLAKDSMEADPYLQHMVDRPKEVTDDFGMSDVSVASLRQSPLAPVFGVLSAVSCGLSAYHGYKRNQSIPWALVWGAMGTVFPVVTPAIAFGQGFGQRR
jgi:hypothetical protein